MEANERRRLAQVAEEAARTIYEALNEAQAQARTNLFNARLMGDIGGPDLIKRREQELEDAKQCLRAWAAANPSTGYQRWFGRETNQKQINDLAAQIGAAAEASVRNR